MDRRSGRGCLLCSRKRSTGQKVKNNLKNNGSLYDWALKHGELGQKIIKEFDTEENEKSGIKTEELTSKSAKKIHWVCDKGHKWQAPTAAFAEQNGRNVKLIGRRPLPLY